MVLLESLVFGTTELTTPIVRGYKEPHIVMLKRPCNMKSNV